MGSNYTNSQRKAAEFNKDVMLDNMINEWQLLCGFIREEGLQQKWEAYRTLHQPPPPAETDTGEDIRD